MIQIKSFTCNPFSENTYILYTESKEAWLLDPGNFTDAETKNITNFISNNSLNITRIVLTHAHLDHIFGLEEMQNLYQVPVYLHSNEKEILDHNPTTAKMFGFQMDPFEGPLEYCKENESAFLGDEEIRYLLVPGHSPGSLAFYAKDSQFVVSGDALFQGSIGRTDLFKGNHSQLIESITTRLFSLPDDTRVYPGHGDSTTIGEEKATNPYF